MSNPAAGVVAAILAGGRGSRMGGGPGQGERGGSGASVTKGLLVIDGQRIIDRQLAVLRPRFAEVIIAANDPQPWAGLGLRVVVDRTSGDLGSIGPIGPMGGLDAVLAALPDQVGAVVCVASDMPFLAAPLLDQLRDRAPGAAALVPRVAGRAEPLLARYARAVAPVVAAQIAAGRYAMVDLLARLDVTWIDEPELRTFDPQLRSLANVNTRADLARWDPHDHPRDPKPRT